MKKLIFFATFFFLMGGAIAQPSNELKYIFQLTTDSTYFHGSTYYEPTTFTLWDDYEQLKFWLHIVTPTNPIGTFIPLNRYEQWNNCNIVTYHTKMDDSVLNTLSVCGYTLTVYFGGFVQKHFKAGGIELPRYQCILKN